MARGPVLNVDEFKVFLFEGLCMSNVVRMLVKFSYLQCANCG